MTAILGDGRGGHVEIRADEVAPVLRVESGECGRADEVAEHDRDRATLG
jgi:hypothetical protein